MKVRELSAESTSAERDFTVNPTSHCEGAARGRKMPAKLRSDLLK